MRRFRLLVAIAGIVCLASIAYIKEYFAKSELISQLGLANDRLRLAVKAGKSLGWELDFKTGKYSCFGDMHDMLGIPSDRFVGRTEDFYHYVHPEDRQLVEKAVADATQDRKPYAAEFRVVRRDGAVRWVAATGRTCYANNGEVSKVLGMAVDISERKRADSMLASVTGRLIEAQEEERRRIARELHDDIGQRLALLAIGLAQLQQGQPDSSGLPLRVGELQKQTAEIAADIQSLSHELHSSRLQYLGLAVVLSSYCREFGVQQNVEIDFKSHDLPTPLSPGISLCLFRILQEALHNSAKYSGVRQFEARLWGTPEEIHLTVQDLGVGFDVGEAKAGPGLGLVSMQERVKLLGGTLAIESRLQHGTTIHARVPLPKNSEAVAAESV